MRIDINEYIIADSEICHGKPTFKNTRIMVWQVLEMMEHGESMDAIIDEFPSLTHESIKAALHYVSDLTRGKNNVTIPA